MQRTVQLKPKATHTDGKHRHASFKSKSRSKSRSKSKSKPATKPVPKLLTVKPEAKAAKSKSKSKSNTKSQTKSRKRAATPPPAARGGRPTEATFAQFVTAYQRGEQLAHRTLTLAQARQEAATLWVSKRDAAAAAAAGTAAPSSTS